MVGWKAGKRIINIPIDVTNATERIISNMGKQIRDLVDTRFAYNITTSKGSGVLEDRVREIIFSREIVKDLARVITNEQIKELENKKAMEFYK